MKSIRILTYFASTIIAILVILRLCNVKIEYFHYTVSVLLIVLALLFLLNAILLKSRK